jgi:hypothetical protein
MSLGGLTSSNIDSIGDESENANEYKIANGWVIIRARRRISPLAIHYQSHD